MTRLWRPLLTVAALVVLLTFLMLRGTGPDPRRSGEQLGLVDAASTRTA